MRAKPMNDRFLKTGIFLAPFHPLAENPLLALDRDMELLVHLDRLNYHEAWIGEHHSGGFEIIACPGAVHRRRGRAHAPHPPRHRRRLAALSQPVHRRRAPDAARLHDARPRHVRRRAGLAGLRCGQDGAQARGPAAQARRVARRHHGADAGPHGDQEDRLVRPAGGAPAAQELLAADDGDGGGRRRALRSARWRPASTASACSRSAARRTTRSKAHAGNWGVYEESARASGKTPDRRKVAHRHLRPRGGDARAGARGRRRSAWRTSSAISARSRPSRSSRPTSPPTRRTIWCRPGLACIGTPDDCIRHFERLWTGSNGGFGGVLLLAHNWADWPATKRSYELMARYVHPHFQRNANELRDWSYDDAKAKYADRRRPVEGRRAGGDRQASGAQGLSPRRIPSRLFEPRRWVTPPRRARSTETAGRLSPCAPTLPFQGRVKIPARSAA